MRKVNPFFVSSVSLAALSASPAIAQQAQTDASQPQSQQSVEPSPTLKCDNLPAGVKRPADCETITVTGTRIRRPNLESPLPVTSIGGQEFFQTGNGSVGDKLAG